MTDGFNRKKEISWNYSMTHLQRISPTLSASIFKIPGISCHRNY